MRDAILFIEDIDDRASKPHDRAWLGRFTGVILTRRFLVVALSLSVELDTAVYCRHRHQSGSMLMELPAGIA